MFPWISVGIGVMFFLYGLACLITRRVKGNFGVYTPRKGPLVYWALSLSCTAAGLLMIGAGLSLALA